LPDATVPEASKVPIQPTIPAPVQTAEQPSQEPIADQTKAPDVPEGTVPEASESPTDVPIPIPVPPADGQLDAKTSSLSGTTKAEIGIGVGVVVVVALLLLALALRRRKPAGYEGGLGTMASCEGDMQDFEGLGQAAPLVSGTEGLAALPLAAAPVAGSMQGVTPRVVVIGSTSVGKTSLINQIISSRFDLLTAPTTGTAFHLYKSDHPIHPEVELWDTAGMERFWSVNTSFYREAAGAILVFDLTSYASFEEMGSWLREFIAHAPANPAIVLCGNKCDLGGSMEVDEDAVRIFCQDHHLSYYQTSALSGNGVSEMMCALLSQIPMSQVAVSTAQAVGSEKSWTCY
jgi:small GTP-binding protein